MGNEHTGFVGLQCADVTGQRVVQVSDVPVDATVGELVDGLLSQMSLPKNDVTGRPLSYHARLEREGRHLHSAETVGEALESGDRLILHPNVDAG